MYCRDLDGSAKDGSSTHKLSVFITASGSYLLVHQFCLVVLAWSADM